MSVSLQKMFDITNIEILLNLFLSYARYSKFTAHSFVTIYIICNIYVFTYILFLKTTENRVE